MVVIAEKKLFYEHFDGFAVGACLDGHYIYTLR
ncbi:MAG: hypothetical protein BWY72_02368 [Bacteroidetes bacterium ADurb.Bin416]|nr:MAG: hypothetical protein BWY72_02368 [Bacteroidetes bacterium ADurb.Bin416]